MVRLEAGKPCPRCKNDNVSTRPGKVDQSGDTFLRAIVTYCKICGIEQYDVVDPKWESYFSKDFQVVPRTD